MSEVGSRRMIFGEIISSIESALFPIYMKLTLADAIIDPIKMQIQCLGELLASIIISNATGGGVMSG